MIEMKHNERLINELKDINNLSFYQYNKYVSPLYDDNCIMIEDSYYINEISDDIKSIFINDLERVSVKSFYEMLSSDDTEGLIIVHEYSVYGDYSGNGSVSMSNHRILCGKYYHIDLRGGYDSHMAGISVNFLIDNFTDEIDNKTDEVLSIYKSLDSYPLIDDEDHSNLEYDLSIESFENYYKDDLIRYIEDKFSVDIDDYEMKENYSLWDLSEYLSDKTSTYWENEYTSMQIDIDRLVDGMDQSDFNEYFSKV